MPYKVGVYLWGIVLIIWLFVVVLALFGSHPGWYKSLQDHDALTAAVTAVLGVVWSWFLELDSRPKSGRVSRSKRD
jgi:hypothetical protein